jgi:hypothetical protein
MEISSLSLYDRAALAATFYYYSDDRVNCAKALEAYLKRSHSYDTAKAAIEKRFYCKAVSSSPRVTIDGFNFYKCLCNFKHPMFDLYVDLAERFDQGILPDSGSYLDQPAKVLEGIRVIKRIRLEQQIAERLQEQKVKKQHGR